MYPSQTHSIESHKTYVLTPKGLNVHGLTKPV
jgi:hypothetical protein